MAKWLLIIGGNCNDPLREVEFNEWASNIHVPDVLASPSFVSAKRFRQVFIRGTEYEKNNPEVLKAKYLATYEIESDDIDLVIKTLNARLELRDKSRTTDLLEVVVRGVYKQTE